MLKAWTLLLAGLVAACPGPSAAAVVAGAVRAVVPGSSGGAAGAAAVAAGAISAPLLSPLTGPSLAGTLPSLLGPGLLSPPASSAPGIRSRVGRLNFARPNAGAENTAPGFSAGIAGPSNPGTKSELPGFRAFGNGTVGVPASARAIRSLGLKRRFAELRSAFAARKVPRTVYAGVRVTKDGFEASIKDGERVTTRFIAYEGRDKTGAVAAWFRDYAAENRVKVAGAGVVGLKRPGRLSSRLWLGEDIVPVPVAGSRDSAEAARRAAESFVVEDGIPVAKAVVLDSREVAVAPLTPLKDYAASVDREDFARLIKEARSFEGRMVFFSSTERGGGVALMRHALIRLLRLVGVDASWFVLEPDKEVFEITKRKFHNVLQAVAPEGTDLTEDDKEKLRRWWAKNAARFETVFKGASVIVIDDYQPSGLIPYIQKANPKARILYRSHIQIRSDLIAQPATVQRKVWDFIWENAKRAQVFISHPIAEFVPHTVPEGMRAFMPATTDPLDGLNKPLARREIDYYLGLINSRLVRLGQKPIKNGRAYVVQIGRFDPSKGIPDALRAYKLFRERLRREGVPDAEAPQLVFAGHGAIDDVQGGEIYRATLAEIRKTYPEFSSDIKAVALPGVDQFLNALRRDSLFAEQYSRAEGFEINVTEALIKGKPVVATRAGGIVLQVLDGVTGHLIGVGDAEAGADRMHRLFTDPAHYERLSRAASAERPKLFTLHNAIRWLILARP